MGNVIIMPKLTHDMEVGTIVEWNVREGDCVQPGDTLFSVETDKTVVGVEAEIEGAIQEIRVKAGEEVPVGTICALYCDS